MFWLQCITVNRKSSTVQVQVYMYHPACSGVGGVYFTTDMRHMLYGDDGSKSRLSITDCHQATGPWPKPHSLSCYGNTTLKKRFFSPNGRKLMDRCQSLAELLESIYSETRGCVHVNDYVSYR